MLILRSTRIAINDIKAIRMKDKLEWLNWDSNFFGFQVCKIKEAYSIDTELPEILKYASSQKIDLIYHSGLKPLSNLECVSELYQIKVVDKKTTYIKNTIGRSIDNSTILGYKNDFPDANLLQLAVESGKYSRFNIDDNITRAKFQELYQLLLINSVNKKIAREVLVYEQNNTIVGLITLTEKHANGDIGILAVSPNCRGRGIGRSLMCAAENWFYDNNYHAIQVVTQAENVPACRLYESCGYSVDRIEYYYHIWRK